MTELLTWAPLLAVLIAAGALWRSFAVDRSKENRSRFKTLEDKVDGKAESLAVGILAGKVDMLEDRMTIVQNDLKHLPDKDVTHRLELALASMGAELRGLSERVKPIASMADRMQEALLEKVMSK